MPEKSNDSNEAPPKPVRLEGLNTRPSSMLGSGAGRPTRGRFTPNMVDRRSKEDRQNTAPAIKPEPRTEIKKQEGPGQRRKPRGAGARAEAAGPLAAPSTIDPRRVNRSGGGGGGGGGGFSRRTFTPMSSAGNVMSQGLDEGGLDVGSTGTDRPFFPLRAQKKAIATSTVEEHNDTVENEEIPDLGEDNLYLFELPKLDLDRADEMTDTLDSTTVQGQIGTLQYHKSGKVTMLLGETVMDVTLGASVGSVEDVVLVEPETVLRLGQIDQRFVVIPDVSQF